MSEVDSLQVASLQFTENFFEWIPNEILKQILVFLPLADLGRAAQVCRLWALIVNLSWEDACNIWWTARYKSHKVWSQIPLKECLPRTTDFKWMAKCFITVNTKISTGLGIAIEGTNVAFGEFRNGELNGIGVYIYNEDGYYVGEWKDGYRNGKGRYTWSKDTVYEGGWKNGHRNGDSFCSWPTGFSFRTTFQDGLPADREECFHPHLKRCLKENICTATVTKKDKRYGQILYECSCSKCFCLVCAKHCHDEADEASHHMRETWVHCLDYCACCNNPEKCVFWKHH